MPKASAFEGSHINGFSDETAVAFLEFVNGPTPDHATAFAGRLVAEGVALADVFGLADMLSRSGAYLAAAVRDAREDTDNGEST